MGPPRQCEAEGSPASRRCHRKGGHLDDLGYAGQRQRPCEATACRAPQASSVSFVSSQLARSLMHGWPSILAGHGNW
jgi:hypothetical protein